MTSPKPWPDLWAASLEAQFDTRWLAEGRALLASALRATFEPPEGAEAAEDQPGLEVSLHLSMRERHAIRLSLWPLPRAVLTRSLEQLSPGPFVDGLADALEREGLSLLPERDEDLVASCSCEDAQPCHHVAAALLALGPQLGVEPELLLALRGLSAQPAETMPSNPARPPGAKPVHPKAPRRPSREREAAERDPRSEGVENPASQPLEAMLDDFWSAGRALARFQTRPRPPELPLLVLRQLGPPPFLREDLARILGPAYARIAERALETAFASPMMEEE